MSVKEFESLISYNQNNEQLLLATPAVASTSFHTTRDQYHTLVT